MFSKLEFCYFLYSFCEIKMSVLVFTKQLLLHHLFSLREGFLGWCLFIVHCCFNNVIWEMTRLLKKSTGPFEKDGLFCLLY